MKKNILSHTAINDYLLYLDSLDKDALRNEFYACHRLKKAITARTNQICREVYNVYRPFFVEYDEDDITNYRHYLIRVLSNFEKFLGQQRRYINVLRDLYDPRPLRSIKIPEPFNDASVFQEYERLMDKFKRLEGLVSSFESVNGKSLSFAQKARALDDNDASFKEELQETYKEVAEIVRFEMHCDISAFKDKRS